LRRAPRKDHGKISALFTGELVFFQFLQTPVLCVQKNMVFDIQWAYEGSKRSVETSISGRLFSN